MSKLGYTWYPENWWTSDAFFELEDEPLVRYAFREIIDLLYSKEGQVKMNKRLLKSRFRIELNDEQFDLLKEQFETEGDLWSHSKVEKRMTKAQSARENGKKGGRPKGTIKTQKPNKKTKEENPKNPPLERESKREIEIKDKVEEEENKTTTDNNFESIDLLKKQYLANEKLVEAVLSIPKKNKLLNYNHLKSRLDEFNAELNSKSIFHKTWDDYTSHFLNWNRKSQTEVHQLNTSGPNIPVG